MGEAFNVQFLGFTYKVTDAFFFAEVDRLFQFSLRKRTGLCSYRDHLISKSIMSCFQKIGGIHTSGKGNRHAFQLAEIGFQIFFFF